MNVFTNGFPKSGNHALVKACELIRIPAEVKHDAYFSDKRGYTHKIVIKRDPRNILVSMLRFNGQEVTEGTFISRFRKFTTDSLVQEIKLFAPWLEDKNVLVVKYEELISSDKVMREIAKYVGEDYIKGAWERLPGRTITWNERHSDFREIWNDRVDRIFRSEGGRELLETWGYRWNY